MESRLKFRVISWVLMPVVVLLIVVFKAVTMKSDRTIAVLAPSTGAVKAKVDSESVNIDPDDFHLFDVGRGQHTVTTTDASGATHSSYLRIDRDHELQIVPASPTQCLAVCAMSRVNGQLSQFRCHTKHTGAAPFTVPSDAEVSRVRLPAMKNFTGTLVTDLPCDALSLSDAELAVRLKL